MPSFLPQSLSGVLNAATWTAIAPSGNWDHVVCSNLDGAAAVRIRTSSGDAGTEIIVPVGTERVIVSSPPRVNTTQGSKQVNYRFLDGVTVFYMKTDSGTGTGMSLVWA